MNLPFTITRLRRSKSLQSTKRIQANPLSNGFRFPHQGRLGPGLASSESHAYGRKKKPMERVKSFMIGRKSRQPASVRVHNLTGISFSAKNFFTSLTV